MAEFEELRLTVNLVDNASAGIANIRKELAQLSQSAGEVNQHLSNAAKATQEIGKSQQHIRSANQEMREFKRSAEETARGLLQMGLAARGGIERLPELALGLRAATQGFKGVTASMQALPAAAQAAISAIAPIAIGVTALGAAFAAYSISVFKFSREVFALSQTARSIGLTFGQLKEATEQGERFGVSAETVIRGLQGIQEAQTNLQQNNSSLRKQMLQQGLDPNWINQFARAEPSVQAPNMARQQAINIMTARLGEGYTTNAARGIANQFLRQLGQDPGLIDRPAAKEMSAEDRQRWDRIERQSNEIHKVWAEIYETIQKITAEFLGMGLPLVAAELRLIKPLFDAIYWVVHGISTAIEAIGRALAKLEPPGWMKRMAAAIGTGALNALVPGLGTIVGAVGGGGNAAEEKKPEETGPEAFKRGGGRTSPSLEDQAGVKDIGRGLPGVPNGSHVGPGTGPGAERTTRPDQTTRPDVPPAKGLDSLPAAPKGLEQMHGSGGRGAELYQKLLTGFRNSKLNGVVPPDGAQFGIKTGSPEEWARFGTSVAHAESGFNPRTANTSDPGGSFGVFQYAHGQVPGGNAYDVDASVNAFVRDSEASQHGLRSGTLGKRFSTIGSHPERGAAYLSQAAKLGGAAPPSGAPGAMLAATGQPPEAFIMHHTGSRGDISGLQSILRQRGLGVEYAMDREGNIQKIGAPGAANIMPESKYRQSPILGAGHPFLTNQNIVGMEVIAKDDKDVTPAQRAAATKFIGQNYPNTPVFGHGEVNPGHKEADEGMGITSAIRGERSALNRAAIDKQNGSTINSTGKLSVDVKAPAGTKVDYAGDNLLKSTQMQRQTQMMPTAIGPNVRDTADSYMRGGN